MTYNVWSGTLNPTAPTHLVNEYIPRKSSVYFTTESVRENVCVVASTMLTNFSFICLKAFTKMSTGCG